MISAYNISLSEVYLVLFLRDNESTCVYYAPALREMALILLNMLLLSLLIVLLNSSVGELVRSGFNLGCDLIMICSILKHCCCLRLMLAWWNITCTLWQELNLLLLLMSNSLRIELHLKFALRAHRLVIYLRS